MSTRPASFLGAAEPDIALAERLFEELRRRTSASRGISRASYGLGEQIAHDIVRREAERLGLLVFTDPAANLHVMLPGEDRAREIIIGSHMDSVPMGGNFDGAAGVLLGLAVLAGLVSAGETLSCPMRLLVIRAEESAWFGTSYIGSRAAFGNLSSAELHHVRRAGDGVTLGAAIAAAGGDPQALSAGSRTLEPSNILLFLEPHIEQGPVLLEQGVPVGLVTSIRGSFRYRHARCLGAYAHSGATPRGGRRDAVLAVARLAVELDAIWERRNAAGEDLTVTVGQFTTDSEEASFSKIAGDVRFSLDVRSADPNTLEAMRGDLAEVLTRIEAREKVRFDLGSLTSSEPARMSPALLKALRAAARSTKVPHIEMPCGAGHDAAVFAHEGVPTGMVFIRNAHGSHNPEEHMELSDFAEAARVVMALVRDPTPAS